MPGCSYVVAGALPLTEPPGPPLSRTCWSTGGAYAAAQAPALLNIAAQRGSPQARTWMARADRAGRPSLEGVRFLAGRRSLSGDGERLCVVVAGLAGVCGPGGELSSRGRGTAPTGRRQCLLGGLIPGGIGKEITAAHA